MQINGFNEQEISSIIEEYARIKNFYIYMSPSSNSGLLMYLAEDGSIWSLMLDDNLLNDACVKFLTIKGVPIFHTTESAKDYEEKMKMR